MVSRPRNGLSLCAGGGGLDLGLMLAEPGFHTRCFVEWEPYPRSALVAGMQAGTFAPAPIWDDVTTFDGTPFRGAIDTVLAGYPCQPFSAAGQRKGADDERHLWPDVARIIREIRPEWVFLENVAGHISLGLEAVLRELWDMDFTPAAGLFTAAETGATHERGRIFIVAHRAGEGFPQRRPTAWPTADSQRGTGLVTELERFGRELADAHGGQWPDEREQRGGELGFQPQGGNAGREVVGDARHTIGGPRPAAGHDSHRPNPGRAQGDRGAGKPSADVDHATSPRCNPTGQGAEADSQGGQCLSGDGCDELVHPAGIGRREGRPEPSLRIGRDSPAASTGSTVADASSTGPQGRERRGSSDQRHGAAASGPTAERGGLPLFPPGPSAADAWAHVLAADFTRAPALSRRDAKTAALSLAALFTPDEADALLSGQIEMAWRGILATLGNEAGLVVVKAQALARFRDVADGLAGRSRALRLLGNGVVPIQAAYAWRTLAAAHGLRPVDMAAYR